MSIWGFLDFSSKRTFDSISIEELRRERITWQNALSRYEQEIQQIKLDERPLMGDFQAAQTPQQKSIAGRIIQDGRARIESLETRVKECEKMVRLTGNLIAVKESESNNKNSNITSVINSMDISEIETSLNQTALENALKNDKIDSLIDIQETASGQKNESTVEAPLNDFISSLEKEIEEKKMS